MGYTPLFDTLTKGTLYGRWPDIGLWALMLSMADPRGHIDVTPEYIAGAAGLPVEEVLACIERFMSPDPRSRSRSEDGRRLVLIDPDRSWGWKVVNHGLYRERARELSRTASGEHAEKQRRYRERQKAKAQQQAGALPDVTRRYPQSPENPQGDPEIPSGDPIQTKTTDKDIYTHTHRARAREPVDNYAEWLKVRAAYPKFAGRQDWLFAQKHATELVLEERATWSELLAAVQRYAAYVAAGGVSSSRYVMTPGRFFSAPDEPWNQAWDPPEPAQPKSATPGYRTARSLEELEADAREKGLDPYAEEA